jgi:hypothetical protein
MICRKLSVILLSALAWLAIVPSPVFAEWFADLFVGPAFTQNHDVVTKAGPQVFAPAGFTARFKDVKFDDSVSFGGRLGHWFESAPYVGLALDASHFRPQIGKQTVTDCITGIPGLGCLSNVTLFQINVAVTGISFDALLRWPLLTSKDFPKGQLQPYLTVGPTIFVARITDSINFSSPPNDSDINTSVGVKAGAGMAWQFHRNVALFGEYRFTHFSPEFTIRNEFVGKVKTKTDIDTHGAVFGVSFRFP